MIAPRSVWHDPVAIAMMAGMGNGWRRTAVSLGWILIGIALLVPSVWVVVQAVNAGSEQDMTVWAGWANVLALPVAALGTSMVFFDRARSRETRRASHTDPTSERGPLWMSRSPDTGLVERADLMAELLAQLLDPDDETVGIAGVVGAGGFGKTTLVTQASTRPELRDRFPGGLLWISVGQSVRGPELAQTINDVTEQLTGTRPALSSPQHAGHRLGVELDKLPPTLLILDDVWTPEQLRPFLNGGARCKRLITTRVPRLLPHSARLIEVDEMSRTEAATLLTRGIAAFPVASTTVILELTGRWPLLTALVNGVLRWRTDHGETLPRAIETVVRQLSIDGPTSLDITALAERERAVDLTVRASMELLSDAGRRRFTELGTFPGAICVPDTQSTLLWSRSDGCDPSEAESLRGALADLSLVQRQVDGIRLHDVLRSYLRHRLTPTDLGRVNAELAAAARGFVDVADDAEPFPWWRLPADQDYWWRHLCFHLQEAGRQIELSRTATNLEYVSAKIQYLGVPAVESDLARVPGERSGVLRSRLSTNAHLLAPTEPPSSFRDLLVARLDGVPLLAEAVRDFAGQSTDSARIVVKWPLPDLGPSSLARVVVGGLGWLQSCAVSPAGWIAAGNQHGTIGVWELSTGMAITHLSGHDGEVTALAISPDAAWIVSAGADGTVRVWDAARYRLIRTMGLHVGPATDCAVSPDSTRIASVGDDRTLHVVDLVTGRPLFSHRSDDEGSGGGLKKCDFRSTDVVLTVATYGEVVSHDLTSGESRRLLKPDGVVVSAMALAPDHTWIALTGVDDEILRFQLTTGGVDAAGLSGHEGFVTALLVVGDRLVSGGQDGTIRTWDLSTDRPVSVVKAHTSWVNCCALSEDHRSLVSAGTDGMLRIWNTPMPEHESVDGHVDWVNALDIAPDGTQLASGGNDGTVRFWEAEAAVPAGLVRTSGAIWGCAYGPTGRVLVALAGNESHVLRYANGHWSGELLMYHSLLGMDCGELSPDGRMIAMAGLRGDVLVRSMDNPSTEIAGWSHSSRVTAVRFTADGESIMFGDTAGELLHWRFRSGEPTVVASGLPPVKALAWSAGRTRLACVSMSDLRLFDSQTMQLLVVSALLDGTPNNDGSASGDGRWLATAMATAGEDGELRIYSLVSFDLVASMRVDGALFAIRWRPNSYDVYAAGRRGSTPSRSGQHRLPGEDRSGRWAVTALTNPAVLSPILRCWPRPQRRW